MRKVLFLCAIMALAALSAAGIASASSNLANGTTVTGTNVGGIALGGIITCNSSTVKATITNNGAGAGATGSITSASFTNCGAGNSVQATSLPWTLTTLAGGGPTVWPGAVDGVVVDLTLGSSTCKYSGNLSGAGGNYDNSTERLTLAGNLNFVSGTGICVLNQHPSVSGQYSLSPTLQLS